MTHEAPIGARKWGRLLGAVVVLTLTAACEQAPTETLQAGPIKIDIVSGNNQAAYAGEELAEPLVLRVQDESGTPVPGQIVNFRVTEGGGRVFAGAGLTNAYGIVMERWTLGDVPGDAQTVEARAVDSSTGQHLVFETFRATALDPDAPLGVATVTVAPATFTLTVGRARYFVATFRDALGNELTEQEIVWSTSDASVATINSASGRAVGRGVGTVVITGTSNGQSGSATVTVVAADEPAPAPVTVPGTPGTPQITVSAAGADSISVVATWAAVDGATSYDWGTGRDTNPWMLQSSTSGTTITFKAPRLADSYWFCVFAVNTAGRSSSPACNSYLAPEDPNAPAPVASISVTPTTHSMAVGSARRYIATARDAAGNVLDGRTVTWRSSNTAVATVGSTGRALGRSPGIVEITATSEGRSATAVLTITGGSEPVAPAPPPPPPPPPSAGALFESSWSSATGNSTSALTDGGKWDSLICPLSVAQEVLSIVPGSAAGWTATPNVMEIRNRGGASCGQVEERNSVAQGQDFFVRMYIRVEDENTPNFHPVDLNCCGAIQTALWAIFDPVAGVDYNAKLSFETPNGSTFRRWKPSRKLRQGVWYRFEWHVDILDASTGTARIWPRVYDLNGTLVYDANSFVGIDQSSETLGQFYARGGTARFSDMDLARRYAVGYEGTAGATNTGRRWYYAAVEIRGDTWPGPVQ